MSVQESSIDEVESWIPRRSPRGFAAMDPARRSEIASLGGRAAHESGHAHEFTSEGARAAGRRRHELAAAAASERRARMQREHEAR